jgi:predicted translin family RNA/ssDNA-binding protein
MATKQTRADLEKRNAELENLLGLRDDEIRALEAERAEEAHINALEAAQIIPPTLREKIIESLPGVMIDALNAIEAVHQQDIESAERALTRIIEGVASASREIERARSLRHSELERMGFRLSQEIVSLYS